ncbi:MAG: hypothetical protein K9J21_10515 [Bacteroidales bacterium]|nr:hypothetical protein [Bacteroidales bacterium]
MKYSFSLEKLILRRIPWALRQSQRTAWIKAMHAYLFKLNDEFKQFVLDTKYKLKIDGRKIYLEHYLNDLYDDVQRRIYIETNQLPDQLFLFKKQEIPALYLSRLWINTTTYTVGNVVNYRGVNYQATSSNSNRRPDNYPSIWEVIGNSYYLTKADFDESNDFTIVFPSTILIDMEFERKVRGLINPYVVTGKKFNIINV